MQNALERGDSLEKAKQSFMNSGYTPEEVETAVSKLSTSPQSQSTPQAEVAIPVAQLKPSTQPLPAQPQFKQTKQASKAFLVGLAIISVIILGAAAAVGLFWDKIFG